MKKLVQSNGKVNIRKVKPEQGQVMKLLFKHLYFFIKLGADGVADILYFIDFFLSVTCLWQRSWQVAQLV